MLIENVQRISRNFPKFYEIVFKILRNTSLNFQKLIFWRREIRAPTEFFVGKWILNNFLFRLFFHIITIFGSIKPWGQCILSFQYIIIFSTWQSFETPSSTLGGIDMCAHWIFCRKLKSQQLLLQPFFHIIGIFGSVKP